MEKDFDAWNEVKKAVHEEPDLFGVHQRELWWIRFGLNVGVEMDGKHETFERMQEKVSHLVLMYEAPHKGGTSRRPKP